MFLLHIFSEKRDLQQEQKHNTRWPSGGSGVAVLALSFSRCSAVDLLALLKWKAYPDRVMDILGRLRHVSGEEIVKVLHEIAVFGCARDGK